MSKTLTKPEQPAGFRDYSPAQMITRRQMIQKIESVYLRFGFLPLQTSTGHKRHVLTGGKNISNRLWNMHVDTSSLMTEDDQHVSARFDLTVPLARFVASHIGEISWPFRRFEVGNVFRGESPQAGRYCEFMQFDADIVGAHAGPADAEIISCMATVMRELGIERFVIKINSRKILNGFAAQFGFQPNSGSTAALLRTMDKLDKIGLNGVLSELKSKTPPPGEENIFAFDEQQIERVIEFLQLTEGCSTNHERLSVLERYFKDGPGQEGVEELKLIAQLLEASGVNAEQWMIDPAVARGLGYYTGPVFETFLLDKPEFGSVYSGGRYDDLVARFTGESLPSVGTSIGVDRLFAALESLGVINHDQSEVDVFIITMEPKLLGDYFAMASELRQAGIRVEVNMNYQDTSMRAQMSIALKRGAPVVLFYGGRDAAAGTVAVKDTRTRKQENVKRETLVEWVSELLTS